MQKMNLINNNNPFAKAVSGKIETSKGFQMSDLFTDNNPSGYFTRKELFSYIDDMSEYQLKKLTLFFDYMSEGYQITSLPIPIEDRETGEMVLWVVFKTPTGLQKFRMKFHDWVLSIVKHCIKGVFTGVKFDTQKIVDEMMNDNSAV